MKTTRAATLFKAELSEVSDRVSAMATELDAPLDALVRAQSEAARIQLRAAVTLAAALGEPDTTALREKRIYLATSLEMLYVALHVHKLLLSRPDELEKSILGSTILAGDYCFSSSASMAVRTEDPRVVEVFAQALKRVSEGNLRQIFGDAQDQYDENKVLFQAGIEAASILTGASADVCKCLNSVVSDLARRVRAGLVLGATDIQAVPDHQKARWEAMLQWFDENHQNGISPTSNPPFTRLTS